MTEQASTRRKPVAGRRRSPDIDGEIRHAARVLYARHGWAGLHVRDVAVAAGVSKDAAIQRSVGPLVRDARMQEG